MLQVNSCEMLSYVGLSPLIRPQITTWPPNRCITGLGLGSLTATCSRNGKHLDRVPYYGYMGSVSCRPLLTLLLRLIFLLEAGSGKTVIWYVNLPVFPSRGLTVSVSSRIIQEIAAICDSGRASLAYFYHDFRDIEKRDRRGLLLSMLVQLSNRSDSYFDILSKLYFEHDNGCQSPSDHALVCCFNNMANLPQQPPIFLIVDALDECPNTYALPSPREKVLLLVQDLVDSRIPNLRICVTSRPEVDITQVLVPLTFRSISLHEERGQMEDIKEFINSVVHADGRMRRWRPEHKQLVIDVLTYRADGM